MAKLQAFEIVFDGDNIDVFKCGDTIQGYIKIVLCEPKNDVRGIQIKFEGKASTDWSEGTGDDKKNYYATEKYFKESITCWGKDGPIILKASTDKSAYVPGESIFVSGVIENNSSRRVIDITIKLVQRVICFSSMGNNTRRYNTIVKDKAPGCGGGEVARMDWKPLVIPSIPPTGPQGCNIIKIEYMVKFEGNVSSTPFFAVVSLPVTIGTIPLYQPAYADPSAVITNQPSSTASAPPEPPPPNYEVAMGGPQEIPTKDGYTSSKLMYAPQYPTYSLPVQPPTWDPLYPPQQGDPVYPAGGPAYPQSVDQATPLLSVERRHQLASAL